MTLPDTLLVNGTDLRDLLIVGDLSGLHAPGTRRGDNVRIPGRRGATYVEKVYDEYSFDIPVTVPPDNPDGTIPATPELRRARYVANLRAVEEVIDTGALVLTRRFATSSGHEDMTCDGEYAGGRAMTLLNAETGKTILTFVNLDGCWIDGTGGLHL